MQLQAEMQELHSRNNQLMMDLQQNMAAKDHHQNVVMQLQHQVAIYKKEAELKEEMKMQLEVRTNYEDEVRTKSTSYV